jgi:SAM-dependent methyltransferase
LDLYRAEAKASVPVDEPSTARECEWGRVLVRPAPQYPYTIFTVEKEGRTLERELHYGHLALVKMITEYSFSTVLDIGAREGTAAQVFDFLGKQVSAVEIDASFDSEYFGDYCDIVFPRAFDAIWCSHVLEHQRYPGRFLDKLFSDLREGGLLAITVPSSLSPLVLGHCNIYTPLLLTYNLISAGFDCRRARVKCYDWQFSILVEKKPNGIPKHVVGAVHHPKGVNGCTVSFHQLLESFPREIAEQFMAQGSIIWGEIDSIHSD